MRVTAAVLPKLAVALVHQGPTVASFCAHSSHILDTSPLLGRDITNIFPILGLAFHFLRADILNFVEVQFMFSSVFANQVCRDFLGFLLNGLWFYGDP